MKTFQIRRNRIATGESKNGGVDLRTGVKDLGGKLADLFNIEDGLKKDRDGTVFGSSGECGVAVGDLFLKGDDNDSRGWGSKGKLHEEGGGDGVGKISTHVGSGGVLRKGF
jgi:hypothetical protein